MNPHDFRSLAGRRAVAASVGTARRRRAVAASVGTAGLMLAVVAGVASCSGRDDAGPGASTSPPPPAKTPEPSESTAVDDARPFVYAAGSTIHYGDQTVDVGRVVDFVEATDDGFVYVTENDNRRLWFTDGSSAATRIGRVAGPHIGDYPVLTANPGALVAWQTPTSSPTGEIVVYDTDRREIVTSRFADSGFPYLVAVNGDRVYWEDDRRDRGLMRFDLSTGTWQAVSLGSLRADLASNPRMLVIDRSTPGVEDGAEPEMAQRLAFFKLVGRQLVATDSISRGVEGNTTEPTTLGDGRPLRPTVPKGYDGTEGTLAAVQWLDGDHLVLFAYHEHNEFPSHVGDFLTCPVPAGTCQVVVLASETPYVPPGDVP